ncbi:MAG: HEAT repeat domain-containing protein [Chloroflexota bacterium]|nr:HEAT repeat domain-containing protein [Chloroflexota bacterium]
MELGAAMSLPVEEPIEVVLADLKSDAPLSNSRLVRLSNLGPAELKLLEEAWLMIESKRRRQIIYRLAEMAEDNIELDFDSVFKNSLKDPDAEVRSKAVDGLWENEDPSLVAPLIALLENDTSAEVQAAAARGLGKFAVLAENEKLRSCYKSKVSQMLLTVFNDVARSLEVRRRALEAVAPFSLPEVTRAIKLAYQGGSAKLKVSAIYAMGQNCDPAWLPALLKELTSPDAELRYEAVVACGDLGEEEATGAVIKLVDDPDTDVRLAAIHALGKIGGGEAKSRLENLLNNASELVQLAAQEALQQLQAWEDPTSFHVED